MKVILDCNVIISAGLTNGTCRKLILEMFENHTLCISEDILIEYQGVTAREKFKSVRHYLYSLIEIICEISDLITITKFNFTLPDKKDLIYLNTALSANAEYLITGNIKDFPKERYKNCIIISPADFLKLK